MARYDELIRKLREIFQIDKPDLDFGIYRIINQRAGLIEDYLQNRLREKIAAALSAGASDYENAVFSHLLTFFSRYYDDGDFISQRRY